MYIAFEVLNPPFPLQDVTIEAVTAYDANANSVPTIHALDIAPELAIATGINEDRVSAFLTRNAFPDLAPDAVSNQTLVISVAISYVGDGSRRRSAQNIVVAARDGTERVRGSPTLRVVIVGENVANPDDVIGGEGGDSKADSGTAALSTGISTALIVVGVVTMVGVGGVAAAVVARNRRNGGSAKALTSLDDSSETDQRAKESRHRPATRRAAQGSTGRGRGRPQRTVSGTMTTTATATQSSSAYADYYYYDGTDGYTAGSGSGSYDGYYDESVSGVSNR